MRIRLTPATSPRGPVAMPGSWAEAAHPEAGQTLPDAAMRAGAYSWCKAPRLAGRTMETGALARQAVDGHPLGRALAAEGGVRARVAARLLEIARTQIALEAMQAAIAPEAAFMRYLGAFPRLEVRGPGWSRRRAAPWAIGSRDQRTGRLASYQNRSVRRPGISAPRDASGTPGPVEARAGRRASARDDGTRRCRCQHMLAQLLIHSMVLTVGIDPALSPGCGAVARGGLSARSWPAANLRCPRT